MQYDNSFKQEALELSDEIGVRKAWEQLGIPYYTLADWRYIRKHQGASYFVGSGYKCKPVDEKDRRIQELGKSNKDAVLSAVIQTIIDESVFNDNYGVPRMQIRGQKVGMRKLRRIMLKMGLIHERKRRPRGLTKATTEIQEKENLIRQDFSADKPYTRLLTDISQIQCIDGKLCISPIIDCFNGEILSLIMRDNMKKELLYRIPTYRMKMSEVKSWIFKYVFTYYNTVRIYTSNPSGLPSAEYRRMVLYEALTA